jgi:hypothetical protein
VSSNVITNTGPASLVVATAGIVSTDGPIAIESSLDIGGALEVAADVVISALFDDDGSVDAAGVPAEAAPPAFEGAIFSTRVSVARGVASGFVEVEVMVGKEEPNGEE